MPGTQLSRRHFSIRAREGQRKLKQGSKKMASNCWIDFINPTLIPIKITFFLIMGATQCVAPYSTLLMKALGLSLKETAIIYTVAPFIPIVAPFLAGIMTDKIGNFRTFLVCTVALTGILALINVLIPPARSKLLLESDVSKFDLTCDAESFKISYAEIEKCKTHNRSVTVNTVNATRCGYLCSPPALQMDYNLQKKANRLTVQSFYNDTYAFSCEIGLAEKQKCFVNNLNKTVNSNEFHMQNVVLDFEKAKRTEKMLTLILKSYLVTPADANTFDCKTGDLSSEISIRKLSISATSKDTKKNSGDAPEYVQCKFHCEGILGVNSTCNNTSEVVVHDVQLSFWLFVLTKMIGAFMTGLTYSMFEAGVVSVLKEFNYDYGIQRVYGSVGGMLFAPLSGYLIDFFGNGSHYSDYYIAYFLYCILKIFSALILTKLDLRFRSPARSICGNISEIFSCIESLLLIIIVFVSGMCYGFIENFLPWHIRDLGAENWIIGLMTTVASIAAIPFLILSDFMCKRFGYVQCISFGLICYSIRCLGYSLLINPYWCFPFEVLEGVTTGLLVAAAIIYGAKLSHQENVGTLQGMLATSHYGFGKSAGSLSGGFLMAKFGARTAFQIFCGGSLAIAFSYYLFFKLKIQPKEEQIERRRKEVSAMPFEVLSKKSSVEGLENSEKEASSSEEKFPLTSTPKRGSRIIEEQS